MRKSGYKGIRVYGYKGIGKKAAGIEVGYLLNFRDIPNKFKRLLYDEK